MQEKMGVFICTGYGIAEALDVDALRKVATDEFHVPFCKTVDSCEGSGLQSIIEEIKTNRLDKVLIAGISSRRYPDTVFPADAVVEKLALREHVVWCQPPNNEDTQMLAEDYLRIYLTKLQKMSIPTPFQPEEPIDKTILVVGGGVAGMTAALQSAKAGYRVRLVEKSGKLGGWLARQYKSIPTHPPYRELEDTGADQLIGEVSSNPRIQVYTSAHTSHIQGAPGRQSRRDGSGQV
jgi:quinone-modifying oxidoreductase subunit QmoB